MSRLILLFLLISASTHGYELLSQTNLYDDLIAFYPLDLDARDYSGNCLHGTNYGASSTNNRLNIAGKAKRFDGKDDFIEIPHCELFNFTNEEDFAISLWVKLDKGQSDLDTTDNDILSKWVINDSTIDHLSTGYPFTLRVINKKNRRKNFFYWAQFGGYGNACKSKVDPHSNSSIRDNEFMHVLLNVKANRFYFYINGVLERMEGSSVMCDPSNLAPLRIGKRGGGAYSNHFKGVVDDLALWSRALSTDEIKLISGERFEMNIHLLNLVKSQEIVMRDTLFFDTDNWTLSDEQELIISQYRSYLDLDKHYNLIIEGHTNNLCESSYCEELSLRRAEIVRSYLWEQGYKCDGIIPIGLGKQYQIASNEYPNTRKKNQRVEISLYEIDKK